MTRVFFRGVLASLRSSTEIRLFHHSAPRTSLVIRISRIACARGYVLKSTFVAALLNSSWVRREPFLTSVMPGCFGSTRVFTNLRGSSGIMLEKIVPSAPDVIDRNSADDSCRAEQRFRGPLDETVDDQGESSKDQSCGHEGKEGDAVSVGNHGSCASKTKDRREGQGHEQREHEPAVDEKLFVRLGSLIDGSLIA